MLGARDERRLGSRLGYRLIGLGEGDMLGVLPRVVLLDDPFRYWECGRLLEDLPRFLEIGWGCCRR